MSHVQLTGRSELAESRRYTSVEDPHKVFELDAVDTQRTPVTAREREVARMLASMEPLERCGARKLTPPWSTPSTSLDIFLNSRVGLPPSNTVQRGTAGRFHIDDATPIRPGGGESSSTAYNRYRTRQQYDRELIDSLPPLPWKGNPSLRSPGRQIPLRPVVTGSRALETVGDEQAGGCKSRKGPVSRVVKVVKDVGRKLKRLWREKAQR